MMMTSLLKVALVATAFLAGAALGWEARIAGGGSVGRLEVRPTGASQWGTVCDDFFGTNEALAACRSVFPGRTITRARAIPRYGGGTGPIYIDDMDCPSNAQSIAWCHVPTYPHNCRHYEDVGIECGDVAYEFNITGGVRNSTYAEGVVVARTGDTQPWGVICSAWLPEVATAACHTVGFPVGRTYATLLDWSSLPNNPYSGQHNIQAVLRSPICSGATNLTGCWFRHGGVCNASNVFAVACRVLNAARAAAGWQYRLEPIAVSPTVPNRGVLLARPNPDVPFGTVCAARVDPYLARVACRSLGHPDATFYTSGGFTLSYVTPTAVPSLNAPSFLDSFNCTGDEATLDQCAAGINASSGCAPRAVMVVDCNAWQATMPGVMIANTMVGAVRVRPNSTGDYQDVCSQGTSRMDARAVCQSIRPSHFVNSANVLLPSAARAWNDPVGATNLVCGQRFSFGGCAFSSGAQAFCSQDGALRVSCEFEDQRNATHWRLQHVGGRVMLQVAPPLGPNSYICRSGVGANAAYAMCRALGYGVNVSAVVTTSNEYVFYTGRILAGLQCPPGAENLDECELLNSAFSTPCSIYDTAALACYENFAPGTTYDTRVVSWNTPGATPGVVGLIQVRPATTPPRPWGHVCMPSWQPTVTQQTALAFCYAAGFTSTSIAAPVVLPTTGNSISYGTAWIGGVACPNVTTMTLGGWQRCPFDAPGVNCSNEPPVAVDCLASQWSVRLALPNGTYVDNSFAKNETLLGRLEVRPNSTAPWGTVCDDGFSTASARAACVALGYPYDDVYGRMRLGEFSNSLPPYDGAPIYMNNVQCRPGDTTLRECPRSYVANGTCNHGEDVYLECARLSQTDFGDWGFRIAGGGTRGRLEVRPNGTAEWGTVCDDMFGTVDAIVACRSIFGPNATAATAIHRWGGGTGPIYMDDVYCASADLPSLDFCTYTSRHNCGHYEDVGISCGISFDWQIRLVANRTLPGSGTLPPTWNTTGQVNITEGRLEVRPNATAPWGTVCDDSFSNVDAEAVCRELGFWGPEWSAVALSASGTFGIGSGPIYMDDVACESGQLLSECVYNANHNCWHGEDVAIRCIRGGYVDPGNVSSWNYRILPTNPGIAKRGLLQLRPSNQPEAPWGAVCDDFFGQRQAYVACRSLGYTTRFPTFWSAQYQLNAEWNSPWLSSLGPFYMDDVRCTGQERDLGQCNFTGFDDCSQREAILIDCNDWEHDVAGGYRSDTEIAGRLYVRPNNTALWGTVCDDGFGNVDALVACAALGNGRRVINAEIQDQSLYPVDGVNAAPIYMDDLECQSTSLASLASCAFVSHNCQHSEDIALRCTYPFGATTYPPTPSGGPWPTSPPLPTATSPARDWEARLHPGESEGTSGLVQVRPAGTQEPWGTICLSAVAMDSNGRPLGYAPEVICGMLGFARSDATFERFTTSSPSDMGPVWMTDLFCANAQAENLFECTYTNSAWNTCQAGLLEVVCSAGGTIVPSDVTIEFSSTVGLFHILPHAVHPVPHHVGGRRRRQQVQVEQPVRGDGDDDDHVQTTAVAEASASSSSTSSTSSSSDAAKSSSDEHQDVGQTQTWGPSTTGTFSWSPWTRPPDTALPTMTSAPYLPDPPVDLSASRYVLCATSKDSLSVDAGTVLCKSAYGDDAVGGVLTVRELPAGGVEPLPIYATSMSCPSAYSPIGACTFINRTLGNGTLAGWQQTCPTFNHLECIRRDTADSWRASLQGGQLAVRVATELTPQRICGSTVDWAVGVASCRSLGFYTADVLINRQPVTYPYDAADVAYNCGSNAASDAPANLRDCQTTVFRNDTEWETPTACGVETRIECTGIAWEFQKGGGAGDDFNYVVLRPSPSQEFRHVALSPIGPNEFVLNDDTLEVACRSIGEFRKLFRREFKMVEAGGLQISSPYITDPECDASEASAPMLTRCQYRYTGGDSPQRVMHVLAVKCDIFPTWLIAALVVAGIVLIAIIVLIIVCVVRRNSGRRRRMAADANAAMGDDVARAPSNPIAAADVEFTSLNGSAVAGYAYPQQASPALHHQRERWRAIVRGHAQVTAEPFDFTLLAAISDQFRRLAPPLPPTVSSTAAPRDVLVLDCVDVDSGLAHCCAASITAVPVSAARYTAERLVALAAAASDISNSGSSCLPAIYGICIASHASDDLAALAASLRLPAPSPGFTFVAVLHELTPSNWRGSDVLAERVVKPPEMQRAAGWIARSASIIAEAGLAFDVSPHNIAFRNGAPAGAPYPCLVWAPHNSVAFSAMQALTGGLEQLAQLTACTVLPAAPPPTFASLVGQLEAVGDMNHQWVPRMPFNGGVGAPVPTTTSAPAMTSTPPQRPAARPGVYQDADALTAAAVADDERPEVATRDAQPVVATVVEAPATSPSQDPAAPAVAAVPLHNADDDVDVVVVDDTDEQHQRPTATRSVVTPTRDDEASATPPPPPEDEVQEAV